MSIKLKKAVETAGVYLDVKKLSGSIPAKLEDVLYIALLGAQTARDKEYVESAANINDLSPKNLLDDGQTCFSEAQAEAINEALYNVVTQIMSISYIQENMVAFFETRYGLEPIIYQECTGGEDA